MGDDVSKPAGEHASGICYICQQPTEITEKKGICFKCENVVCKKCSKITIPPGRKIKLPQCE